MLGLGFCRGQPELDLLSDSEKKQMLVKRLETNWHQTEEKSKTAFLLNTHVNIYAPSVCYTHVSAGEERLVFLLVVVFVLNRIFTSKFPNTASPNEVSPHHFFFFNNNFWSVADGWTSKRFEWKAWLLIFSTILTRLCLLSTVPHLEIGCTRGSTSGGV